MSESYKFKLIACEGTKIATFIEVPIHGFIGIIFALSQSHGRMEHEKLYQLAISEGVLSEKYKVTGGGVIDLDTYETASSISFGPANDDTIDRLIYHLRKKNYRNYCD